MLMKNSLCVLSSLSIIVIKLYVGNTSQSR